MAETHKQTIPEEIQFNKPNDAAPTSTRIQMLIADSLKRLFEGQSAHCLSIQTLGRDETQEFAQNHEKNIVWQYIQDNPDHARLTNPTIQNGAISLLWLKAGAEIGSLHNPFATGKRPHEPMSCLEKCLESKECTPESEAMIHCETLLLQAVQNAIAIVGEKYDQHSPQLNTILFDHEGRDMSAVYAFRMIKVASHSNSDLEELFKAVMAHDQNAIQKKMELLMLRFLHEVTHMVRGKEIEQSNGGIFPEVAAIAMECLHGCGTPAFQEEMEKWCHYSTDKIYGRALITALRFIQKKLIEEPLCIIKPMYERNQKWQHFGIDDCIYTRRIRLEAYQHDPDTIALSHALREGIDCIPQPQRDQLLTQWTNELLMMTGKEIDDSCFEEPEIEPCKEVPVSWSKELTQEPKYQSLTQRGHQVRLILDPLQSDPKLHVKTTIARTEVSPKDIKDYIVKHRPFGVWEAEAYNENRKEYCQITVTSGRDGWGAALCSGSSRENLMGVIESTLSSKAA